MLAVLIQCKYCPPFVLLVKHCKSIIYIYLKFQLREDKSYFYSFFFTEFFFSVYTLHKKRFGCKLVCLSFWLPLWMSINLPVCLSVCLIIYLTVCLFIHLSIYLSLNLTNHKIKANNYNFFIIKTTMKAHTDTHPHTQTQTQQHTQTQTQQHIYTHTNTHTHTHTHTSLV